VGRTVLLPLKNYSTQRNPHRIRLVNELSIRTYRGCRNVRCCQDTDIKPALLEARRDEIWIFRWEYYCLTCREYEWCGAKARGYMVAR
jgi:hypothetical protein